MDNNLSLLGGNLLQSIIHWIKSILNLYEKMWLNHFKKHATGFEVRTTSITEFMRSSMKSYYEGAHVNFSCIRQQI